MIDLLFNEPVLTSTGIVAVMGFITDLNCTFFRRCKKFVKRWRWF